MSNVHKKALTAHRRRRDRTVIRVEVQIPAADAGLMRKLATILRGNALRAQGVRDRLLAAVARSPAASVFDIFGSDLSDGHFDGVFEERRHGDLARTGASGIDPFAFGD